jgi:hypothetical protein
MTIIILTWLHFLDISVRYKNYREREIDKLNEHAIMY